MAKPRHSTRQPKRKSPAPREIGPRPTPHWAAWCAERGLWITLLAALLAQIGHWISVLRYDPLYAYTLPTSDMQTYWNWAKQVAGGDWLSAKAQSGAFYYGPLYTYFLAVLIRLFGENFHVVHGAQALLGVLPPVAMWAACRRLFGRGPALATGLLAAVCAPFLFYEQTLLMEGLLIAVHAGILLCLVYGQESPRRGWLWALGGGALSGMACWGRGNFLLVVPLIAAAWLIVPRLIARLQSPAAEAPQSAIGSTELAEVRNPKSTVQNPKSAGAVTAVIYVVGVALLLSLTLWRNHHVSGAWVLTTNNGPVLAYLGNASDSFGFFYYPPSYETLTARYGSANAVPWGRELLRDLSAHPFAFLRLLVNKTWMFWNSYDTADNVSYYLYKRYFWLIRWSPVTWLTLLPLAILGVWETRGLWRRQVFLYVYTVGLALSIIALIVVGRYRLPAMLPMLVWAGPATTNLIRLAWERRWKSTGTRALVWAAGVCLLWPAWSTAIFANSPRATIGVRFIRAQDYQRLAIACSRIGQTTEARGLMEECYSYYPWVDFVVFYLAAIYNDDDQPQKVVALLESYATMKGTLERDGVLELANAYARLRQDDKAFALLEDFLRQNPNDDGARRLLQRIRTAR